MPPGPPQWTRRSALALLGAGAIPSRASTASAGALRVKVVSTDTGAVIPCSVALHGANGELVIENRSYTAGFRSSGEFQKELPAGPARLVISRGFDFVAETRDVNIRSGETAELEVRLRRRTPLRRLGWLCGDHHVHMTHGESRIRVDFDYLALAARAEGLDCLSVAQSWNLPDPTADAAEGECRRVSTADCMLAWNLEAPKNYYRGDASRCIGHCWFAGARPSPTIAAELLGLSAQDYESNKTPTPNFESHALIHREGGVIAYTHPCRWWTGEWGGQGGYPVEQRKFISNLAAELPFDTVAGPTYDAIDILMQTHEKQVNAQGLAVWFLLLNRGYRVRASTSSDATFDNEGRGTPGKVRLYTRVDGAPSMPAVAEAIRAGRSFVTSGPLVLFDVDGRGPGESIVSGRPARHVARIRAWASGIPGEHLSAIELIRNGEVVKTLRVAAGETSFEAEHSWIEEGNAWMVVRCFGRDRDNQVAITNPVFFDRPGFTPPQPARAAVRIEVSDAAAGRRLGGTCEVVEMVGREARPLFRREFRDGVLELEAPATARLRVESPGFRPLTRSVFLDSAPILDATLAMRAERLLDWSTYEGMRRLLREVRLTFPMAKV